MTRPQLKRKGIIKMIDIEAFVKKNYQKIKDLGLSVKTDESNVIKSMKKFPQDMLNDLGEEGIVSFLFSAIEFSNVFYTDFEGVEYADFLKECQHISGDELSFEDVTNNVSKDTLEKGTGTSEVSFICNGKEYNYTAKFYYDWFDTGFIRYLNTIFEENGLDKRLIVFGDPNASLITYQAPDFCTRLKEAFPMLEASV